jgi:hypothetical protein
MMMIFIFLTNMHSNFDDFEDDDLIDRTLDTLSGLWDEMPQPTSWVNPAEVETDADAVLAVVARMPAEFEGVCTYARLRYGTGLNDLRLDRAMQWLVEKGLTRSVKRDVWLFEPQQTARLETKFDVLLDDRLLAVFTLLAPQMTDVQRGVAIDCLNQISRLRPGNGGVHFVP